MMTVAQRFLKYTGFETTSCEMSESCPSTPGQMELARALVEELQEMGVTDARVDAHGYVYASIPPKGDHPARVGLIAHMDTSDGVKGPTHAQVISNYDGKAVTLKNGVVIDGFDFLESLKGQDLIVTDGESVLGADDKAGVAEIMALAALLTAPDAPEHCRVCIAFTPDEEIGRGADLFDVAGFGADYAYTVDGGALGELEYENFNAASAVVESWGLTPKQWESRLTAKHIFTHVEWHMTGYTLEVAGDGPADFVWAGAEELGERAVPSAFARYSDEAKRRLGGWKED